VLSVSREFQGPQTPGNSILLIDLENFYLAREQTSGTYRASELSSDLEELSRFLGDVAVDSRDDARPRHCRSTTCRGGRTC
jgi:hypothetical protein